MENTVHARQRLICLPILHFVVEVSLDTWQVRSMGLGSAAAAGPKLPPREKGMAAPSRAGKGPRREKGTAARACSAAGEGEKGRPPCHEGCRREPRAAPLLHSHGRRIRCVHCRRAWAWSSGPSAVAVEDGECDCTASVRASGMRGEWKILFTRGKD